MNEASTHPARLSTLREVEGVLGSFLIDASGKLLARDIPVVFDADALAQASVQLARLRVALESAGGAFEGCVTRFGPHVLVLRAARQDTLCVLCPHGTNLGAVQMSATMFARHALGGVSLPPPPPGSPRESSARDSTPPAAAGRPAARSFRGRPL